MQPFFPALEPLQSLNLRAALFRCLNDLKKNEILGKEVILRKTLFDDCKGEKVQELLSSFSSLVLRKVLADEHGGKASISGRLVIAHRVTVDEHASFLPLAIAHRASLTALLRRKGDLRTRYNGFRQKVNMKEQELDRRFEAVVQTQDFLDANPVPDHTVSRISKLFEKHWQGDATLGEAVIRGQESAEEDPLFDQPFSKTWPKISDGTFDGSVKSSSCGLLEDLEKRVADQEARLNQWKEFKASIKAGVKSSPGKKLQSPVLARARSNQPDLQNQRDLVFSPRKSPRKSDKNMESREDLESPLPLIHTAPDFMTKDNKVDMSTPIKGGRSGATNGRAGYQALECEDKWSAIAVSPRTSPVDGSDSQNDSGFSEISNGDMHLVDRPQASRGDMIIRHSSSGGAIHDTRYNNRAEIEEPKSKTFESTKTSNDLDEDDLLANQIISATLNAAPTPAKPKLSLVERTRQSILASSSPNSFAKPTTEDISTHLPAITENHSSHNSPIPYNPQATLLERTRQSISLVPPKPRGPSSRQSTAHNDHRRRTSKIYPTNQFETPKKQTSKQFVTPPEELFSPGAGYDSVFKSRPKVGFSPVTSPAPDDVDGGEAGLGDGESPSMRGVGR